MRCFIAINIDKTIRSALDDLQKLLQKKADTRKGDVKWVNPDAIHLTLKFLGEIDNKQVVDICNTTKEVAGRSESFELGVESVGYFGDKSARVLWVGISHGMDKLMQLQKELETAINGLPCASWPAETREFAGHLTLCRIKNVKAGFKLAKLSEDYRDFKLGTIFAGSLNIYQSQLTPAGPIYTVLGKYKMRET